MTIPAAAILACSNAVKHTQNTAPVLEFRCLYTPDLRRKQKRWQDGRLKYHMFNKRIMVYDDRCNFVGDSHWREDRAFGEGEEVELERCGILVEVSECVGTREQDLAPLFSKVMKDKRERAHGQAVASSLLRHPGLDIETQVAGTSRAEPIERSAKRRKPTGSPSGRNGYAQNLTGTMLVLSGIPSAAAPRNYDPGWSRSIKQTIEDIDMSSTAWANRLPQERPVTVPQIQTKAGRSQAKSISKNSTPASVNSSCSRNIAGVALVHASKTFTGRRLSPASKIAKMVPTRLGESGDPATITERDEFIDIDVFDKENLHDKKTTKASSPITELLRNRPKKPSPHLPPHQASSERHQSERPFNPLRIRTRPKMKLLSIANRPSRPPLFNEPIVESFDGAICLPAPSKTGRKMRPSVVVSPAVSVPETRLLNMEERLSSSPEIVRMDHHGIDVLLTRRPLRHIIVAEEVHANVQPGIQDLSLTQHAAESKDHGGGEGQGRIMSGLISAPQLRLKKKNTQSSEQLSIVHGSTDTENLKTRTGSLKNFNAPPQSMRSRSEGARDKGLHGIKNITTAENLKILKPTYQDGKTLTEKLCIIPFTPPLKLACPPNCNLVRRDSEQTGYDENVMVPLVASTRPAVPTSKAKLAPIPSMEQGPWSREAFDLFEWRPGAATEGDSLATS